MESHSNSSEVNSSTRATPNGRRDISQFVKYLLEGSGVTEDSIDFAEIRRELENSNVSNAQDIRQEVIAVAQENKRIDMGSLAELKNNPNEESLVVKQHSETILQETNDVIFDHETFKQSVQDIVEQSNYVEPSAVNSHIWDSMQNFSIPDAIPKISIQTLSDSLKSAGFPPFSQNLLLSNRNSFSDQQNLVQVLYWTLENVLQEYRIKSKFTEHLQRKLKQLGNETNNLASYVDAMNQKHLHEKTELIQKLNLLEKKCVTSTVKCDSLEDEQNQLLQALNISNEENAKWKSKYEKLSQDYYREKERNADYASLIGEKEEEQRRVHDRAKELIRLVTSSNSTQRKKSSPVARDILDIVAYYEDITKDFKGKQFVHHIQSRNEIETQTDPAAVNSYSPTLITSTSPERTRIALLEEIDELRNQLERAVAAFEEEQDEKELLKLKLLSLQPGSTVVSGKESKKAKLDTRELIQRDKHNFKLKLYKIEELSTDESKLILRNICESLNISAIGDLVNSLKEIATTINLVPLMQNYIEQIDSIVWSPSGNLEEFFGDRVKTERSMQKVKDTVKKIKAWRQAIDIDLVVLKQFQELVFGFMKINEDVEISHESFNRGSLRAILNKLKHRISMSDEYASFPTKGN